MTLNDNQRAGVEHVSGPLLILAGAGSGKTRVLTERIANLIKNHRVNPSSIMAITFTNKAAGEMRDRVNAVEGIDARNIWVATFHSSCVRILRKFADKLGYTKDFTIYDSDDSKSTMRELLKRLNIDSKKNSERLFLSFISDCKDKLQKPEDISGNDSNTLMYKQVYKAYSKRLFELNAMDFDDLIVKTVELFKNFPETLDYYQSFLEYFMVDEYQDTNTAQFELVRLLSSKSRNICVVGDDDQSIYKFRGANIYNILHFESYYPDAKVIRLEENYRSTSQILNAANSVIKNNSGRKEKALWTQNPDGENVIYKAYENAYEEAEGVVADIAKRVRDGRCRYQDNAILYRTNAQSRILEEKFLIENIPYRIVGGMNFYQRKEIKDILAYLRVLSNPKDDISLFRIINVPKRGIGDTTIERIMDFAIRNSLSFYEALLKIDMIPEVKKAQVRIGEFVSMMEGFKELASESKVSELIREVLEKSGYNEMLLSLEKEEREARKENLSEFINKAIMFESLNLDGGLTEFLEEVSLVADIDNVTDEEKRVLLMTMHAAKGLEFDNVYLVGLEEGLFPGEKVFYDPSELEEERRLCYVGVTRAKKRLMLTSARQRMVRGNYEVHLVSRFVREMNLPDVELDEPAKPRFISSFDNSFSGPGKKVSPSFNIVTAGTKIEKRAVDFGVGDRVSHSKFGEGKVLDIVDGEKDYEVTVEFDKVGKKRMMASFARLKKV